MLNKCPKCGFYMISSNCPKCGYESIHIYQEMYKSEPNELELFLKDDYLKIINNENSYQIIFLGPLYFIYYKFYPIGIILTILELFINYNIASYLSSIDTISSIALMPLFIAIIILQKFIYLLLYNQLLLQLLKKRLNKIQKKNNYKELIYNYQTKSIIYPIITISIFILILILTFIPIQY